MADHCPRIETRIAQAGSAYKEPTGSISVPIYQTATYRHPGLGHSTGFDYSRTSNPTRAALEAAVAGLEGGCAGFAFASGMAAITSLLLLLRPGDTILVSDDIYGGTYRLLERIFATFGLCASYVDTTDSSAVATAITPATRALFVETPSNPTMRISDLAALGKLAHKHDLIAIADNTFMTPYLQRPLDFGWDVVVHSATKYLAGHNDVVAGLVVARDPAFAQRIAFCQNAAGAVLGPQDSWLTLRGLKTLAVRLDRAQENARRIAIFLANHPAVSRVFYPGHANHPGHNVHDCQASGAGAMLAFAVNEPSLVERIIAKVRLIAFAESLGGVESLITFPALQTHQDIPVEVRRRLGIDDRLLRLSIGIEAADDLIADLTQAMA